MTDTGDGKHGKHGKTPDERMRVRDPGKTSDERGGEKEPGKTPGDRNRMRERAGFSVAGVVAGTLGAVVVAWLFYDRPLGLLPGIPAGIYIARAVRREQEIRRKRRRRELFRRLLLSMQTGLEAGYSLENALITATAETGRIFAGDREVQKLLAEMQRQTELWTPVWQSLLYFGERTGVTEAGEISEVLKIQQRTGGNLIRTMQSTVDKLQAGMELVQETETVLAEKRLEQRIMTLMPAAILLYMRLMNRNYMEPLYLTGVGTLIMTAALALNIAGDLMGQKMISRAIAVPGDS